MKRTIWSKRRFYLAVSMLLLAALLLAQGGAVGPRPAQADKPPPARRLELSLEGLAPGRAAGPAAGPLLPEDAVELVLDDGTVDDAIGVNDETSSYQFIWLNRFTPDPGEYPFSLDQIWVLFVPVTDGNIEVGDAMDLVVYEDADGNPANGAALLATYNASVLAIDGATWSAYNLSPAVDFSGPGDVLIGVINRHVNSGVTPLTWPAAIDMTSSQGRSWAGYWQTDPPDPAVLPPDAVFDVIDSLVEPGGNWLIRGYGETTGAGNTPPTLSGLPDQQVPVDGSADNAIDLWVYADDAEDGDADLTFTISNSPAPGAGVSIDANRYIDIDPDPGWTGSTDVEVEVEDTGGLTDSDTFRVTVAAANTPPTLDWTGELNYLADGLHPESGSPGDSYVYRIEYADADGHPPGSVQVHIEKGGSDIAGSPFSLACASGDYTAGVICSYTKAGLAAGTDYAYYFVAQDNQGSPAIPSPTRDGPDVTSGPELYTFLPLVVLDVCSFPDYFDDFSDPTSGWYTGDNERSRYGYLNGEYQILLKQPSASQLVTPDLVLPADYRVEVDVRRAAGYPGTYGLAFGIAWGQDTWEGYQFVFYAETREFLLEKRTMDGSWPVLIGWTYSPAILTGMATNHLRVDRVGTLITMSINGTQVATYDDGSFTGPGRDAGARAYSTSDGGTDARFDNFHASCVP